MRETKLTVLYQGLVKLCHDTGYNLVGNDEVVSFYFDVDRRAEVDSWTYSSSNCPVVHLDGTIIEFTDFPGWRFHSSNGGDSIAIALVKDAHYLSKTLHLLMEGINNQQFRIFRATMAHTAGRMLFQSNRPNPTLT